MTLVPVSPLAAPALLFAASAVLAALPATAGRAAGLLRPGAGVAALILALDGTRASALASADPLARLLLLLAAIVVALLGFSASGAEASGQGGVRLRLRRAGLPAAGGFALLAPVLAEVASSLGALAGLAFTCAALGATMGGQAAARDAVRRIGLAALAASVGFAGLMLVAAGSAPVGALLLLVAAAALGAVPILAPGLAIVTLPPALAGAVLLLPPIAAASPLLRARAALGAGSTASTIADASLLTAGLASLAIGAAGRWRAQTPPSFGGREIAALSGPALFGWGLGTVSGLQAGFAALVFALLAGIARLEAAWQGPGAARNAATIAAAQLPPFGSFAAVLLLAEATLPTRPLLGASFLLLVAAFSLAVLRPPVEAPASGVAPVGSRRRPVLLALVLALSAVGGMAMPARLANALSDAAGLVAGGVG